jgi:ABC-type transport system involved in cytochrome bd biosynthesis fused ATPase/permease subunit
LLTFKIRFFFLFLLLEKDNTALIVGLTVPLIILFAMVLVVLAVRRKRAGACNRKDMETRGNDSLSLPDSVIETRLVISLLFSFSDK